MPESFGLRGQVRDANGEPLAGVTVVAVDRELPSLRPFDEQELGRAETDQQGGFSIEYRGKQFRSVDEGGPDLVVRLFGRGAPGWTVLRLLVDDHEQDPARPTFNVGPECRVEIIAEPTDDAWSEYERVMAAITPEIAGVPVAELTYDDWTFLADDVGEDRTTIAFASAAAGLARRTGLPAEAFYGLARFSMPNSFAVFPDIDDAAERRQLLKEVFAALTDSGEDELTQVLDEAVRARTVPSWLGERTRAIAARLNQRAMAETELTLRLVDARTRTPLAGCPAELTDPATEGLTDDSGVVTFRYWAVSDHHDPTAHIAVALPDGSHPTATVAVPDRPGLHPLEVRFDLPDPSASLAHDDLRLPQELVAQLAARGIGTMADIRHAGGPGGIEGLSAGDADLRRLAALADLDRLSQDPVVTTAVLDGGFTSVLKIARARKQDFTARIAASYPNLDERLLPVLHDAAVAQTHFLDGVLSGIGSGAANGYPAELGTPFADPVALPGASSCGCAECRTAVGPAAYLADLLDYSLRVLTTDNAPATLDFLVERLHQPLADLPAECGAVGKTVRQARICAEVLRSVLGDRPLSDPVCEAELAAAERDYCSTVYSLLLTAIGTSYDELRRARAESPEYRRALADRLGIALTVPRPDPVTGPGDELDRLLLDPDAAPASTDALTEASLERLFGLADTRRDPLSDGPTLRDDSGQLVRWSLSTPTWGVSTDDDGLVHGDLVQLTPDAFQLILYRDREHLQAVGHGDAPTADGSLTLTSDNGSGLAGSVRLAYLMDDRTLTISGLPALAAWRLRRLREIWAGTDHPSDAYRDGRSAAPLATLPPGTVFPAALAGRIEYSAGELSFAGPMRPEDRDVLLGLSADPSYLAAVAFLYRQSQRPPVIDPDLLGPEDFRHPRPTDPAFALWTARRATVDDWLTELRAATDAQGLGATVDAETGTTRAEFDALAARLAAPSSAADLRAAEDTAAGLGLVPEAVQRLAAVRTAQDGDAPGAAGVAVRREAESILVQARKARRFTQWRADERAAGVGLDGERFWKALREPVDGLWPPPSDAPLLDPDRVRPADLQELFGNPGAPVLETRRSALAQARAELASLLAAEGFDRVLRFALGSPDPGDPVVPDPVGVLTDLDSGGPAAAVAAQQIADTFHLSEAEFRLIMAVRAEIGAAGGPQPSEADRTAALDALAGAHKIKHLYPAWLTEEGDHHLVDWQVLRPSLPPWRAPAGARQTWQQLLQTRCWRPLLDPDVIGPLDLRTVDPGNTAFHLWGQRRGCVDGWRTALQTTRETAPDARTGWERIVTSPDGLDADRSVIAEFGTPADQGVPGQERLDQLGLDRSSFELVRRLGLYASNGQRITSAEWLACYAVLAEARKRRSFAAWRDEEEAHGLLLGPEFFRHADEQTSGAPEPSPEDAGLATTWRTARRDWQGVLDGRIDQQQSTITGLGRAVDSVEETQLPRLRDSLLAVADPDRLAPAERADRFAERYFIDTRTDGCAVTTRIAQAAETLQTLLWSANAGQLHQEVPWGLARLAVAAWGGRRLHLFARSMDGKLWQREFDGRWQPWHHLEGPPVPLAPDTGVSVSTSGPGRLDVVVRGEDLCVWRRSYDGHWSAWEQLDGAIAGTPAVLATGVDTTAVLALRNSDGVLQIRTGDGSWTAWTDVDGEGTTSPSAVSGPAGRIDVVVGAPTPAIRVPVHRWFDGTWHEQLLNGALESDREPVLVSSLPDHLELFKTQGGDLHLRTFDGTWQPWTDLDAGAANPPGLDGDPAAVAPAPGQLEVFAVSGRRGLLRRSFATHSGWGEWSPVPGGEIALDAPDFDQEWRWIGTYADWRAAKFVYYNVEDYLHPMLVARKTPAYRRLLEQAQGDTGLAPQRACLLAGRYADYFGDICTLKVQATCQLRTLVKLSEACGPLSMQYRSLFYQFAAAESGRLYWTATDAEQRPGESNLVWHLVPDSDQTSAPGQPSWSSEILGAVSYGAAPATRSIALFYRIQELGGQQRLMMSHLDVAEFDLVAFEHSAEGLDRSWSGAPTEITDLPGPLADLQVVPVVNDTPNPLPAVVVRSVGNFRTYLREVDPKSGAWVSTAEDWTAHMVQPIHVQSNNPSVLEDEVHGVYAAVRSRGVTWLVFRSQGLRRAWPVGGMSVALGGADGAFLGALPATGGSSPGSVIYVFGEEDGDRVYWRVGDKTGVPVRTSTLADLGPMARHCGVDSGTRVFVYTSALHPRVTYGFRYTEEEYSLAGSVKFVDLPMVTTPRDIPLHIPDGWYTSRASALDQIFKANDGVPPSVLTPLTEAYYLVPLYLALKLQEAGHWDEALALFRTVYDYTAPVGERTIYPGLDASAALPAVAIQQAAADWLLDPLDPHRLAATRRGAHLRYTATAVAHCLSDYGDAEFTRDTPESLGKARLLYAAATDCLNVPELGTSPQKCDDPLGSVLVQPGAAVPPETLAAVGEITDRLTRAGIFIWPDGKLIFESLAGILAAADKPWDRRVADAEAFTVAQLHRAPPQLTLRRVLATNADLTERAHVSLLTSARLDFAAQAVGFVMCTPPGGPIFPVPTGTAGSPASVPAPVLAPPQYLFCLPPAVTATSLRSHLDLSLWKLHTCRNIAGAKREMELYSSPTDAVSGRPALGPGGQLMTATGPAVPPTPYRYAVLIERARHLAQLAGQLEAQMLAALEQRDRQAYDLMRARQDLAAAAANQQLQALRLTEAQSGVGLAELQQDRARVQRDHYAALLTEPISKTEQSAVDYLLNAARYASISQDLYIWSAAIQGVAVGVPILAEAGSGFLAGSVAGGLPGGLVGALGAAASAVFAQAGPIAQLLGTVANSYSSRASQYSTLSSVQSALAGYERRAQEWDLQQRLAAVDMAIGDRQITVANEQVGIVHQEGALSALTADHARATVDFLANKFTSVELYDWMSSVLEGVYRTFLREAAATANLAATELAFERQESAPVTISADYTAGGGAPSSGDTSGSGPGSDRKGLTGTARLLSDIEALDQHAFLTRQRTLQLSTTVSLARLAPMEFQRFRETGVMIFETPMDLFDRDFPGHYLRLIKRVRVSVIALVPPTQGIHATLMSTGISRVVTGPETFQSVTIRRQPEEVALTSPMEATGLFALEPQQSGDLLLPFEGNGVASTWQFSMPKAANAFDYRTVADVLVTFDYTSLDSFDYRQQVIRGLSPSVQVHRGFSLRNDFPDAWYDLHNPELLATEQQMLVRLRTVREDYQPNLDELRIDHLLFHVSGLDPTSRDFGKVDLTFQEATATAAVGGAVSVTDGTASTRQGNAGAWTPIIGRNPLGVWELRLPNTTPVTELFKTERIEDVLLVVSYSGRLPVWPRG